MQRKLATIQRIEAITPIQGADSIERATVMGWSVIVKKDEFLKDDLCVFFEIDSILPNDAPWASFMEPHGFRVKTIKLRGCLSQGLALPLHILQKENHDSYVIGADVTDTLRVTKHEIISASADVAGSFPSDVPKTDETRLQSILSVLDELKNQPFYVTIKLDGMSGTFIRRENELQVCSRNNMLKEGSGIHWAIANRYDLKRNLPIGFAIQGEVVGPGIQKNRLKLTEPDVFIYNVYDINEGRYLDYDQFVIFCHKIGLKTVPIDFEVSEDELSSFSFTLENFLELAKGLYQGTSNRREGIVIRPMKEQRSKTLGGDRLSFKVISNEFLLKDEE
jgi:RNA ligase (TIGR02306 family)